MKRYVIVGASFRCYTMFVENLLDYYPEHGEITGIYDLNKTRCEGFKKRVLFARLENKARKFF